MRDRDRHRSQRDQDEPHALSLGQTEHQEEIAERGQAEHATGRTLQQGGREEQQEDRAELVREAVEAIGLERERDQGHEQVPGSDRHRPLDRVEDLIQPRPPERVAEKGIDRVARVKIGAQVPPPPTRTAAAA